MPLLFWLARRYPVDRQQWTRTLPIHLLASVPIAFLKEAIFVGVGNLFRPGLFDLTDILAEDLSYEVIAVWGFSCLAHAMVFHERFTNGKASDVAPPTEVADHIVVRTANGVRLVRTDDIECIDAQGNYARLSNLARALPGAGYHGAVGKAPRLAIHARSSPHHRPRRPSGTRRAAPARRILASSRFRGTSRIRRSYAPAIRQLWRG